MVAKRASGWTRGSWRNIENYVIYDRSDTARVRRFKDLEFGFKIRTGYMNFESKMAGGLGLNELLVY